MSEIEFLISKSQFEAAIFDLDGVVTQSAKIHAKAWKNMFDAFFQHRDPNSIPFDIQTDYTTYVDGKPRYEGVKSFLESRKIQLPYGSDQDSPDLETICGLGNRKNNLFLKYLKEEGVDVYDASIKLIEKLKSAGFKVGLVTSSKNCSAILEAAGISNLFDTQIDGLIASKQRLKGKPHPDIFLMAAQNLGVHPHKTIVFEDAIAGVQAAARGHFGCVVGVDRRGKTEKLKKAGADIVVSTLAEVRIEYENGK